MVILLLCKILKHSSSSNTILSWKYSVNITRIESRPVSSTNGIAKFDFFVDFHGKVGDVKVDSLLQELKRMTDKLLVLGEKEVSHVACVIVTE